MEDKKFRLEIFEWDMSVVISDIEVIDKDGGSFLSFTCDWDEDSTTKTEDEISDKAGELLILALEQSIFEYGKKA